MQGNICGNMSGTSVVSVWLTVDNVKYVFRLSGISGVFRNLKRGVPIGMWSQVYIFESVQILA